MSMRQALSGSTPHLLGHELAALATLVRSYTVELSAGASRRSKHAGSGVIWDAAGLVVTNAHVAQREGYVVTLAIGEQVEGAVIARDGQRDLAALAIPAPGLVAAAAGDVHRLRAGALLLALGHPLGVSKCSGVRRAASCRPRRRG
ncbi:MAG: trypsin-like peptidase domain-containing protein [Gemmatimonadaceae bacterium]